MSVPARFQCILKTPPTPAYRACVPFSIPIECDSVPPESLQYSRPTG